MKKRRGHVPNEHVRATARATMAKLKQDPAFMAKLSTAVSSSAKARWANPEYKARVGAAISAGKKGKKIVVSEDTRNRSRATLARLRQDPAFMAKTSAAVSAAATARWADPEYKARVSAAISAGKLKRRLALQ